MIPADWHQHLNERGWLPTIATVSTVVTSLMPTRLQDPVSLGSGAMAVAVEHTHCRILPSLPAYGRWRCAGSSAPEVHQC